MLVFPSSSSARDGRTHPIVWGDSIGFATNQLYAVGRELQ